MGHHEVVIGPVRSCLLFLAALLFVLQVPLHGQHATVGLAEALSAPAHGTHTHGDHASHGKHQAPSGDRHDCSCCMPGAVVLPPSVPAPAIVVRTTRRPAEDTASERRRVVTVRARAPPISG